MTLQEAAEDLGIPKKRLWRAIKAGQISAEQVQRGQRWEYRVTSEDLELYRQVLRVEDAGGNDLERVGTSGTDHSRPDGNDPFRGTVHGTTFEERSVPGNVPRNDEVERPGTIAASPPAEVYIALIDRLSRAERRSVELELQLRQSQRLLAENAESIVEKEALATEAKAQLQAVEGKQLEIERLTSELNLLEKSRQAEADRLSAELEATRQQLAEAQKPKGLFSWLGLRKSRTVGSSVDKAV